MRILSWTKILVSNKIRENWVKIPMALAIICAYDLWFIWFFYCKFFFILNREYLNLAEIYTMKGMYKEQQNSNTLP